MYFHPLPVVCCALSELSICCPYVGYPDAIASNINDGVNTHLRQNVEVVLNRSAFLRYVVLTLIDHYITILLDV